MDKWQQSQVREYYTTTKKNTAAYYLLNDLKYAINWKKGRSTGCYHLDVLNNVFMYLNEPKISLEGYTKKLGTVCLWRRELREAKSRERLTLQYVLILYHECHFLKLFF